MTAGPLLLAALGWLATRVIPATVGAAWVLRRQLSFPPRATVKIGLLAVVAAAVALAIRVGGQRLAGGTVGGVIPPYVALGLVGPLEGGLMLAALWPSFRSKALRGPREGVAAVVLVAAIFATIGGLEVLVAPRAWAAPGLAASALVFPTEVAIAAPWAYMLGRSFRRTNPRPGFLLAWLVGAAVHGATAHLLSTQDWGSIAATLPVLLATGVLGYAARLEFRVGHRSHKAPSRGRDRIIVTISLADIREIMARREEPVSLGWVALGALVNQGLLVLMLVGAVVLGNRLGIDFAGVDETTSRAALPLIFLVLAALLSFPIAGYLVARASGVTTMLEPALASALSLIVLAGALGVAAPVGLAFVLASSPFALLLACAGAWLGLGAGDG